MTLPRKQLVAVEDTPYYHVVSRCVRRQWIENRICILSSLFALDICSYCVMSNHIHIVIKLMPQEAESWTDNEVLERLRIYILGRLPSSNGTLTHWIVQLTMKPSIDLLRNTVIVWAIWAGL
jgi:REP element-mobilizing transposase RayT